MAFADEESFGQHPQERGSHRRDHDIKDKEGGRHGPSCTDRRNNENLDSEQREDKHQQGSGHHVQIRNNEKQDRDVRGGDTGIDPSCRRRDLHEPLVRRENLHESRAHKDRHFQKNEVDDRRQDVHDAPGAHRQDALAAHMQGKQKIVEGSSDDHHVKRRRVDSVIGHRNLRTQDANDFSGHHQQMSRDDFSRDYKQRRRDVDSVLDVHSRRSRDVHDVLGDCRQRRCDASDNHSRREQDADNSLSDRICKRVDADRTRWRRDVDDVLDDRRGRRRDADETWDNRSWPGDKSSKRQGINDDLDDVHWRRDGNDMPGDGSGRRRNVDGVVDSHSQRRRDVDDSSHSHRHCVGGVRDQQQRSPRRRRDDIGDIEGDGKGDRFVTRFRNAERNEDELPKLFSVHRAKVQSVRPFGIFVRLEGFYKQGLVHLSQLSDHEVTDREDSDEMKVKAIAAVAGEGDQVWVKIISLKDDGGGVKIGCSLKLVSQSTGKDLDPSNLKFDQQQAKGNRQEPKKVTLDAIYNVVCSRCGGHGHLKTECYGTADKSYELLPEEDDDLTEQLLQSSQAQMPAGEASLKPGFGRGRAMVLPAWMTHGSGVNATQNLGGSEPEKTKKKRKASELPDKITTVEEAMALIAQVKKAKKEKCHRKEHKKHKERKAKKSSNKEISSRKDRG